jgi:ABC-2 type transport system ATP-binding protein
VFVSSHLLAEIEQICTHAGIMRTGRLVAQGSLETLRGGGTVATVTTPDVAVAHEVLARFGGAAQQVATGAAAVAALPEGVAPEAVVDALVAAAVRVRGFTVAGASLEDRFVELTGEGFDVES